MDRTTFEALYREHFDLARSAIRRRGVRRPALDIPIGTADSRFRLARRDMQAANPRLQHRKAGGRAAILPFGTGAWLHLREITSRPPGAVDRLWARIQGTLARERGAEQDMRPSPAKKPWRRQAASLALRAMGPATGAVFGAAATLTYVRTTQAPPRDAPFQPAFTLTQEAQGQPAAPAGLNGLNDESSAALLPPGVGVDPSKIANPAALLALRKAQAAYVVGDRPAALDALGPFEREFAEDPLRISAERLRALVLRPLAATR